LKLPKLPLYYEDLLKDKKEFLNRVFAFLEVEPYPVQDTTLKITRDDLRDVITNFDVLRARYLGTEYETMFDEVVASPN
jgi:hypothetical protein